MMQSLDGEATTKPNSMI